MEAQIFTDASHIAWGGVLSHSYAQGFWPPDISHKSSNFRQLLTVRLVLESFISQVQGKHIQIVSDNITTVAYLNHLGGPCMELNYVASGIWEVALEHNILLSASHIQGRLNYMLDKLSRLNPIYEWQLNPGLFNLLDTLWGPHDIDRFATVANAQLPVYNNRFLDPFTTGVDALAQQDWAEMNNFVNPPFRLLDQVLQVISTGCRGHDYSSCLARSNVVSKTEGPISSASNTITKPKTNVHKRNSSGTATELQVENICLESEWKEKLLASGWSDRAAMQTTLCLASSTWELYNRMLRKFLLFCSRRNIDVNSIERHEIC